MPAKTTCSVPRCTRDARLYPAGWLCDEHCPAASRSVRIPVPSTKEN